MKDLFIEDYELVDQVNTNSACGECVFEFVRCANGAVDLCSRKHNLNKVWKLKQEQNEKPI